MPERVQRRRTKGWRMPEGAIYVGRPSRWGNPASFRGSVERFRQYAASLSGHPSYAKWIGDLRGHDLACWCPVDQPCHADVLLELANR